MMHFKKIMDKKRSTLYRSLLIIAIFVIYYSEFIITKMSVYYYQSTFKILIAVLTIIDNYFLFLSIKKTSNNTLLR